MEDPKSQSQVSCFEDEELDPRVQIELENLNAATDEINSLEASLEEANHAFRSSLNETSLQLQALSKKLGSCVDKARPFYEAKEKAKKLQLDCQRSAVQYQRANAVHQAARETISLAEERFANLKENENSSKERKFDSAWQEMLNHATMKIMEAEAQKSASEREHQKRAAAYTAAETEVQELQRTLKSAINKSRPYFNHRAATQVKLEAQKDRICKLQKDVMLAKNKYSLSLRNLEHISEEIHELRRVNMKREPGVGAEMDQCEAFVETSPSQESFSSLTAEKEHDYWNTLKGKLKQLENEDMNAALSKNGNEARAGEGCVSILVHQDSLSLPYEGATVENEGRSKVGVKSPQPLSKSKNTISPPENRKKGHDSSVQRDNTNGISICDTKFSEDLSNNSSPSCPIQERAPAPVKEEEFCGIEGKVQNAVKNIERCLSEDIQSSDSLSPLVSTNDIKIKL